METSTEQPVVSNIGQTVPFEKLIKGMSKDELIKYADARMGLRIDPKLTKEAIKRELLLIDQGHRQDARKTSEESATASISEKDPPINVKFFNMQTADEDIQFDFPGPRGMFGPVNNEGHKKMPHYHLFPGMEITLPYSVVEHLRSRIFTRHRPIWDQQTGLQSGVIPIITPRFVLEQRLSKEEAIALQQMRKQKE